MNRKLFIVSILLFVLCIFYAHVSCFAQSAELSRYRAGTVVSDEDTLAGTIPVDYFIAEGDKLEVFVWKNPDLTKDVVVGPDGHISLPLAGRINSVGLTLEELEDIITEKLSRYVKYPQVSIMIKEFTGKKIIILGDVTYPGIYSYQGQINLIEAIALAGDFNDKARRDSIMIVRGNPAENPEVKRINLLRVIKKGTAGQELTLQSNDMIFIPRTFVSNFKDFLSDIGDIAGDAQNILSARSAVRTIQQKRR